MSSAETVELDESDQVASIAKQLNRHLLQLDRLGLWAASGHLSLAIEALPGQMAILPPLIDARN